MAIGSEPAGPSGDLPSADRRAAVDDYEARASAQRIVVVALAVATEVALFVGLVPLLYDDPTAIRKVLAALVIGAGGGYLAWLVVAKMGRAVEESDQPSSQAEDQPEPILRLAGVDLRKAALPGADLGRSELTAARLEGADLNDATLHASRMTGADLRNADLRRADLRRADLSRTDLRGADLRGALIADADLSGAVYNEQTEWPEQAPPPQTLGAVDLGKPAE